MVFLRYVLLGALIAVLPCHEGLSADKATQPAGKVQSIKNPKKEKAIRELLQITRVSQLAISVMNEFLTQAMKSAKKLKAEEKKKFRKRINAELNPKEIEDIYVPIYDKHYTLKEIKKLAVFYRSPIGRKLISTQPIIMKEAQNAGKIWSQSVMTRVFAKMKKDYPGMPGKRKPTAQPKSAK